MNQHIVHLEPLGKEFLVKDKTPLVDILHEFGIEFPCGGNGTCGKCKVKLLNGGIEISDIHRHKLDSLGLSHKWRLACYSECTSDITLEIEQFNHLILADESQFEFVPQAGFGVAIDLGTTTIVAQLVDLTSSKVLAVETILNPQNRYGADLISRIQSCMDGNAEEMSQVIRSAVGSMVELLILKEPVEIKRVSIVGNTVMKLIFSDLDVKPLSEYPFHTNNLGRQLFDTDTLDWNFNVSEKVQFYPSIGGFVGSDILAGIAATGLQSKKEYTALIDLGTNGEIVVGNRQQIVCASTAAGPAFEGTNISKGMRAVTGAISSINLSNNKLVVNVIGNVDPKGICGSALVDAVAIFRKLDLIGEFGEIRSEEDCIVIAGDVVLTQKDINEFQLAKAAIAAGLKILCNTISIQLKDIQDLYIAGGFGNYINIKHLVQTGMVELPEDKIHKMGNTALIGAKMFLFSNDKLIEDIFTKIKHVNLESHTNFQAVFVDNMLL